MWREEKKRKKRITTFYSDHPRTTAAVPPVRSAARTPPEARFIGNPLPLPTDAYLPLIPLPRVSRKSHRINYIKAPRTEKRASCRIGLKVLLRSPERLQRRRVIRSVAEAVRHREVNYTYMRVAAENSEITLQ